MYGHGLATQNSFQALLYYGTLGTGIGNNIYEHIPKDIAGFGGEARNTAWLQFVYNT